MNNIKRYDVAPGGSAEDMTPAVDGSWVLFEDALAEVERLRAELQAKDERIARILEGNRQREGYLRSYLRWTTS